LCTFAVYCCVFLTVVCWTPFSDCKSANYRWTWVRHTCPLSKNIQFNQMHLHFCLSNTAALSLSYSKATGGRMVAAAALMAPSRM
jgi:hypothetical protein